LGFSRRLPGPIYILMAQDLSVIVVLIGALLGTYIYGVLKINCLIKYFECSNLAFSCTGKARFIKGQIPLRLNIESVTQSIFLW
jgi:hypothetical protein